jgi:hypothetical protein
MDFHALLSKMKQLDQPVGEQLASECGDMPAMPGAMSTPATPPVTPPSMSINMNAQGMQHIADILKLISKVNSEAPADASLPSMSPPSTIASIAPMSSPTKMLPDLSNEPHGEPDGDEGPVIKMDLDNKKEEYANEPDEEVADVDAVTHDGTDLHKSKGTFPKVAGGDNPMQRMESKDDLRLRIREELMQRLAEAKGVK